MTNKEAIKILEGLAVPVGAESAFDMAIEALKADAVHNDSCDGCKYVGVIEKCEQCRRIYAEFDDLYDKGGDDE